MLAEARQHVWTPPHVLVLDVGSELPSFFFFLFFFFF